MKTKTTKQLREENEILQKCVLDLYWMARRYADGRMSYAVPTCNDAIRKLIDIGLPIKEDPINNRMFAVDGIMVKYHDDCNTELDVNGDCPTCNVHPDTQSVYLSKGYK